MTRGVKIFLVLLLLAAAGAGGWYVWENYGGPGGPDRTELVRQWLMENLHNTNDLQILSCKHVRSQHVVRAREAYPTVEVVDCHFRHRDGLGDMHENDHHFYIVDDKIVFAQGLTFHAAHGRDPNPAQFIVDVITRHKDPAGFARDRQIGPGQGGPRGGRGMMGGPPGGRGGQRGGEQGEGEKAQPPADTEPKATDPADKPKQPDSAPKAPEDKSKEKAEKKKG